MAATMTSKILAKAAGKPRVEVGEFVLAQVDVMSIPDAERFIDMMDKRGLKVWDPQKLIFCFDHFFVDSLPMGASIEHPKIRRFAEAQGIPADNIYDIGRNGLSHQIPVEEGRALPGSVSIGSDTQSSTMGAMNCFSIPALAGSNSVVLTGRLWQVVPECVELILTGAPRRGITGKDIVYRLIKDLGEAVCGRVIEISGPGVASLPIDMRMAIANGAVQIGALTIVFPADARLLDYLKPRARHEFRPVEPDSDAPYVARYSYDLDEFECLIAGPHEIDLVRPLREVAGLQVAAAYIGSCSSGRLDDLKLAADVLRGRKIHPGVRMVVTPISATIAQQAATAGILGAIMDAGASVTGPGCGACYHSNMSPLKLADSERCISSSVENLVGRMGSSSAEIYLGNTAVVAASALEGKIADPSRYLADSTP